MLQASRASAPEPLYPCLQVGTSGSVLLLQPQGARVPGWIPTVFSSNQADYKSQHSISPKVCFLPSLKTLISISARVLDCKYQD